MIKRRKSKEITIGNVKIGNNNPISVQSMCNTDTRNIEQTIRQKLPSDFQTAEYLMKYGQVDVVSSRKKLRENLSNILAMHE